MNMHGIYFYESKHRDGNVIKEHCHSTHEILYVLDGKGEITLDGQTFDFEKDCGVVISPFSNHSIVSYSKLTVLVLVFEESVLDSAIRRDLLENEFSCSKLVRLSLFGDSEVRRLLRKLLFERSQQASLNVLATKIYLEELLLVLASYQTSQQTANVNSVRAEKIRSYIDAHYFEIANASDISTKLGVTSRHVNNIFKENYDVTPIQYLTEVRMRLAQKMLAETEKDIASICFELGFENLSTFYRTFKNKIQLPPNQYRRLHHDGLTQKSAAAQ